MKTFVPRYLQAVGENKEGEKVTCSVRCRPAGNLMVLVVGSSFGRLQKSMMGQGVFCPVFYATAHHHDTYSSISSDSPVEVCLTGALVMPDHSLFVSFARCDFNNA